MKSGIVDLKPIVDFVANDVDGLALKGTSSQGRAYSKLAREVVSSIETTQGFYLWGTYVEGEWVNIYLGKAGKAKTSSLRARILEELRDERPFVWGSVLAEEEILKIGAEFYPNMWDRSYEFQWVRALEKVNTTHIVWVSVPHLSEKEVFDVEKKLIARVNPLANRSRPSVPDDDFALADAIISSFNKEIS